MNTRNWEKYREQPKCLPHCSTQWPLPVHLTDTAAPDIFFSFLFDISSFLFFFTFRSLALAPSTHTNDIIHIGEIYIYAVYTPSHGKREGNCYNIIFFSFLFLIYSRTCNVFTRKERSYEYVCYAPIRKCYIIYVYVYITVIEFCDVGTRDAMHDSYRLLSTTRIRFTKKR